VALVLLLRGVNVGGHRTFRPTTLVRRLKHLDPVNIGAAGTFVFRKRVGQARLRREVARLLPFETQMMLVEGRALARLVADTRFADHAARPDIVRFVSVLARRPRRVPALPLSLPPSGPWLLRVIARHGRFVVGEYRRQMKAIGHVGSLDRQFGVPVTTRNWHTMVAIAKLLASPAAP
jgi:uncharacterized protein (DUF1697 family)